MKKSVLSFVMIVLVSAGIPSIVKAQAKELYVGTWRWVSGNLDTFILLVKPIIQKETGNKPLGPGAQLLGFHSYTEKGKTVESNFDHISDTLSNFSSFIGGVDKNNGVSFMFHDLTRDAYFYGFLKLLPDMPDKALFYTHTEDRKHIMTTPMRGRTVPNNIVLERIK